MGVNKEGDRGGTEEMVTSEERFDSRAVLGPTLRYRAAGTPRVQPRRRGFPFALSSDG